jgi:hypothetical protein
MGNKSWIYWHALYDSSTRFGELDNDELDALRHQIDDINEGLTNDESGNEDEANVGPIQGPACGDEVVCTSCGNEDYTYCCDCQCTCGASLGHLGQCIEKAETEAADDNETSLVSESDSPTDDRDEGPTDEEPGNEDEANVGPIHGLVPQFYIRFKGSSKACNIQLTANMDDLVELVEQITHIPRSNVKMSVGTTSSANMWTDSVSGSMSIVDFGFVKGCTI